MPKAVRRTTSAPTPAGPAPDPAVLEHMRMMCHKRLNMISGSIVLSYKNGLKAPELRGWADDACAIAADMRRAAALLDGEGEV